jgi:hypothetical protein
VSRVEDEGCISMSLYLRDLNIIGISSFIIYKYKNKVELNKEESMYGICS